MAATATPTKPAKTPKLARDEYGTLAEALGSHIDALKKGNGPGVSFTDADIVKLGRLLALKNKCAAIHAVEPKKWTKKAK